MTRKNIIQLALCFGLLGFCGYLNRGWFRSRPIQIGDRSIQPRAWLVDRFKNSPSNPVLFLLDSPIRLTAVKVVDLSETNGEPRTVWQLATASNSVPVKQFVYGMGIQGMKLAVKGAPAQPLQPGGKYRILIEAGKKKAEHDFVPVPHS